MRHVFPRTSHCSAAVGAFVPDKINLRIRVCQLAVKFADLLQGVPDLVEVILDGRSKPRAFVVFQRRLDTRNELVHAATQLIEVVSLVKGRGIFFRGLIYDGNRAQNVEESILTPGAGPEEIQIGFLEALSGFESPRDAFGRSSLDQSPT